jgi:hypothetical protein
MEPVIQWPRFGKWIFRFFKLRARVVDAAIIRREKMQGRMALNMEEKNEH